MVYLINKRGDDRCQCLIVACTSVAWLTGSVAHVGSDKVSAVGTMYSKDCKHRKRATRSANVSYR